MYCARCKKFEKTCWPVFVKECKNFEPEETEK
jgi:hypothetical protein